METFTDQDLLEELSQYFAPHREQGHGITAREYANAIAEKDGKKITIKSARNRLNQMVDNHGWKSKEMIDFDGKIKKVYWKE